MRIVEIFHSLQGEGLLVGAPSVFLRIAGCPLKCKWCDTKYAWDKNAGEEYTIKKIIEQVTNYHCDHIVVTGGEPMTNPELPLLLAELKKAGLHITIETAGFEYLQKLPCDLMSISPKLTNSGQKSHLDIEALTKLINEYEYQLKFVIDTPDDLAEVKQLIKQIGNVEKRKIMLMPQAATREELLKKSKMVAEICKENNYVFCQRLHITLWNGQKGR